MEGGKRGGLASMLCGGGGGRGEAVPDLGGKLRRKSVCGSVCGVQS